MHRIRKTADIRFAKIYEAVDWRRKDYYGQVIQETVQFKVSHNAVMTIGARIYEWIRERIDFELDVEPSVFANFVSYLIKKKIDGGFGEFADTKLPLALIIPLECLGLWLGCV